MSQEPPYARREDADYQLVQGKEDGVFTFKDKRTGHRQRFHDCTANGYNNQIYLYHHPSTAPDDAGATVGYKCAFLDKSSLPDWLIKEFQSIQNMGEMTFATDPRQNDESL